MWRRSASPKASSHRAESDGLAKAPATGFQGSALDGREGHQERRLIERLQERELSARRRDQLVDGHRDARVDPVLQVLRAPGCASSPDIRS